MENTVLDEVEKEVKPNLLKAAWPAGLTAVTYGLLFIYLDSFVSLENSLMYWYFTISLSFILFTLVSRHARKKNFRILSYVQSLGLTFLIYFIAFFISLILCFLFFEEILGDSVSNYLQEEITSIQNDPVLSNEDKDYYIQEARLWSEKPKILLLMIIQNTLFSIPFCFLASLFVMKRN